MLAHAYPGDSLNRFVATPPAVPQLRLFREWLRDQHGLEFKTYDAMWLWSTTDLDAFWQRVWEYAGAESPTPHSAVLGIEKMPGAVWFPGAHVNFAREVLRHAGAADAAGCAAIVSDNELGDVRELSWPELSRQVASVALKLKSFGVTRGDRVAAFMPNVPETMIAFLACSSIGAIWSLCAPDMGVSAVLDRFRQIEPRVLIASDGVHYGGKALDRVGTVLELQAGLPSLRKLIVVQTPFASTKLPADATWSDSIARNDAEVLEFEPEWLPFDHPIWIVYSSGTTGLPKPIVHGQGGIIVTMHASRLHYDIGTSYSLNNFGERFHWYSSTGWVMWNIQLSGLTLGTTICLYDGSPSGNKANADWGVLWRFAAKHNVTYFGAGAAFFTSCMKAGLTLSDCGDLTKVRVLGSTGSPLDEDVQRWGSSQFRNLRPGEPDVWWSNASGGTDFCSAFIGGNRELPSVPGEMQCRWLGCAVDAWDERGNPVTGEMGELVCTRPIPSMPLYFWGDSGNARYLASYFETYPGVWRHGDWLKIGNDGGCVIYGRSDATINRQGLRMGTSEIYSAVESLPEILDSMVVDLEYLGRESYMPLFVVLRPGYSLNDDIRGKLMHAIKTSLSPRFVPDEILEVPEIPRTLSGKKQELPIKRLLLGHPQEKVLNRAAMANPGCIDWYIALAEVRRTAITPGHINRPPQ